MINHGSVPQEGIGLSIAFHIGEQFTTLRRLSSVFAVQLGLLLCLPASPCHADPDWSEAMLEGAERLTTEEIQQLFSGTRDEAQVQDSRGTSAINYWYADGRFVNRWSNKAAAGEVRGTWSARNDKRCIVIKSGLPDRIGIERCTPLYRKGSTIFSVNPDGTVHGAHRLSPLGDHVF